MQHNKYLGGLCVKYFKGVFGTGSSSVNWSHAGRWIVGHFMQVSNNVIGRSSTKNSLEVLDTMCKGFHGFAGYCSQTDCDSLGELPLGQGSNWKLEKVEIHAALIPLWDGAWKRVISVLFTVCSEMSKLLWIFFLVHLLARRRSWLLWSPPPPSISQTSNIGNVHFCAGQGVVTSGLVARWG